MRGKVKDCKEKGNAIAMLTAQPPEKKRDTLPPHSVRVSRKARRISLRVLPATGLEVVLPRGADPACVPEILARYRAWITRTLARMRCPSAESGGPADSLPLSVSLKGGGEELVLLRRADMPRPSAAAPFRGSAADLPHAVPLPGRLTRPPRYRTLQLPESVLRSPPSERLRYLREIVRGYAREYLENMLRALAEQHGFVYARVSIRFQRGRWGSCSDKGNISLNACLVFLPEDLARHILLHELCHTRQMNHSQDFWKLLFSLDPDALVHDKAMRRAWRYVPAWIWPRLSAGAS